jgi:hypothetical protein
LNEFIPLTYVYSTAGNAHKVLEQIVEIQCILAKSTDYGLSGDSVLKVANTPETQFLVQAELNTLKNVKGFFSFKKGLTYKEKEYDNGDSYKGYLNKDGQREGVGILITKGG